MPAKKAETEPRRERTSRLLDVAMSSGQGTLHAQLVSGLRRIIIEGALSPGAKLPASRRLAEDLGISRNTVVAAIEQLAADGVLELRRGSGAYVALSVPHLSDRPGAMQALPGDAEQPPFAPGVPALDLFPLQAWSKLQWRRWRQMPRAGLQEGHSAGWSGLRWSIASHLRLTRGVRCEPEQVIVTSGTRAAVYLAASALAKPGDSAWVESPGYFGTREALAATGLLPVEAPVDEHGLNVAEAERLHPDARFAVVTSHCQMPTGVVLSAERRRALQAWAERTGAWIIDNGYDSETTLGQDRPKPLLADGCSNAIYVNSFNKVMFPSLRIGYAIVPPALVERFAAARHVMDAHSNVANQMVLHDFIESGQFDEHLRVCRQAYTERRDALIEALDRQLGRWFASPPRVAGLHVIVEAPPHVDGSALIQRAAAANLDLTAMTQFTRSPDPKERRFLLGYAGFSPLSLRKAVSRLARVCEGITKAP